MANGKVKNVFITYTAGKTVQILNTRRMSTDRREKDQEDDRKMGAGYAQTHHKQQVTGAQPVSLGIKDWEVGKGEEGERANAWLGAGNGTPDVVVGVCTGTLLGNEFHRCPSPFQRLVLGQDRTWGCAVLG